jgi:hypothetical protein
MWFTHPGRLGTPARQAREERRTTRTSRVGPERAARVRWTICRGETKVSYMETIYPFAFKAEHGLTISKY